MEEEEEEKKDENFNITLINDPDLAEQNFNPENYYVYLRIVNTKNSLIYFLPLSSNARFFLCNTSVAFGVTSNTLS